jgi:hypothetical protein
VKLEPLADNRPPPWDEIILILFFILVLIVVIWTPGAAHAYATTGKVF